MLINVSLKPLCEVEFLARNLGGFVEVSNGEAWLVLEDEVV